MLRTHADLTCEEHGSRSDVAHAGALAEHVHCDSLRSIVCVRARIPSPFCAMTKQTKVHVQHADCSHCDCSCKGAAVLSVNALSALTLLIGQQMRGNTGGAPQ